MKVFKKSVFLLPVAMLATGCPDPAPAPTSSMEATVTTANGSVIDYSSQAGDKVESGIIQLGSPHAGVGSRSTLWVTVNAPSVNYASSDVPAGAKATLLLERSDPNGFQIGDIPIAGLSAPQPIRLYLLKSNGDFCVGADGNVHLTRYVYDLIDRHDLQWSVWTGQVHQLTLAADMNCYTQADMLSNPDVNLATHSTMHVSVRIG